jgi:hypothetical protein
MISYYKYWQSIKQVESSLKTVMAMQPDVPDMVMAQYEMDNMVMKYWKERAEMFTKYFLTGITFVVTLGYLIDKGIIDVHKIIG